MGLNVSYKQAKSTLDGVALLENLTTWNLLRPKILPVAFTVSTRRLQDLGPCMV